MQARIRQIIATTATLARPVEALADTDDLYDTGMTSFASVQLMLALEEAFDIEFPETMLNRRTFASVGAIAQAVGELAGEKV